MNRIEPDDGPGLSACTGLESPLVANLLEEYLDALRDGHPPDRAAFLAEHPEVADELGECLDALELIQSVADDGSSGIGGGAGGRSPLEPGDLLGGFRILREVGHGGMGVVYEAEQIGLPGRRVAVKVLPPTSSLDARTLQRFRIEAQAAACLNHPNIVPVFAVGCERGIPFYAMPLIRGCSLAEVLRASRTGEPAPEPAAIARLGLQAAEALEHAHALGVIHRDIKPSNLLVEPGGRLWVTDFGLARITHDGAGPTRTGDLVGTLRYLSPEQVRGEPGAGDPRADIYALGVTLYEALTLRPAFRAVERSALLHQILNGDPPPPRAIASAIPRDLETVVLKAMDKLPSARYATAGALAEDLRRFLADQPILARRPGPLERAARWSRRHRPLLATALAGLILSMAVGAAGLWRAKQAAEANLEGIRAAHRQDRMGLEWAFRVCDTTALPLLEDAASSGLWPESRRLQAYQELLAFFDRMARPGPSESHQPEMMAKASRRAGALRLAHDDARGRADYDRAVTLYESLVATLPRAIWYRTALISTLREYAGRLELLGEHTLASARLRRAYAVADGLLAERDARYPCFRQELAPEFRALVEQIGRDPASSAAERALAGRLAAWLEDQP